MSTEEKYPIREDWEEYYNTLEDIRQSGITNMWGAGPYLKEIYSGLSHNDANGILSNWIHNYKVLSEKYGWRKN
jgi:hypothetical protein